MAIAALRTGKDVLMEKPMATSYADALDLIREAGRNGRIVAVGIAKVVQPQRHGDAARGGERPHGAGAVDQLPGVSRRLVSGDLEIHRSGDGKEDQLVPA